MKEIKVKAWDGEKFYTPILYGGLVYRSFRDFEDGISTNDKVIQYVGFKDKYGREIYGGDIVKICKKLLGKIEFDEEISAFILRHINYIGYKYLGKWITHYEVIGNIYETPELLEG